MLQLEGAGCTVRGDLSLGPANPCQCVRDHGASRMLLVGKDSGRQWSSECLCVCVWNTLQWNATYSKQQPCLNI